MSDPARPLFVFAHGAGAPSSHPWMRHWQELLATLGAVHAFDYPYMAQRRGPDPLPKLIAAHRAALEAARAAFPGQPVYLIGKSMGGRVGCHLALEETVAGVICLGYPLCGAGDCKKLRDRVLVELATPVLFVQGTRDKLCPLDVFAGVSARMTAPHELAVITGGDHSLLVTKSQLKVDGETQADVDARILAAIARFVTTGSRAAAD